jgi:hypothetical protein
MYTFLHGWRRKTGCVTLVIACMLCGVWIRSLGVSDFVEFNGRYCRYCVQSVIGNFCLIRTTPIREFPLFDFGIEDARRTFNVQVLDDGTLEFDPTTGFTPEWRFDWCAFHISNSTMERYSLPFRIRVCAVPYWSIVLPVTFLAAYLILWTPRKRVDSDA